MRCIGACAERLGVSVSSGPERLSGSLLPHWQVPELPELLVLRASVAAGESWGLVARSCFAVPTARICSPKIPQAHSSPWGSGQALGSLLVSESCSQGRGWRAHGGHGSRSARSRAALSSRQREGVRGCRRAPGSRAAVCGPPVAQNSLSKVLTTRPTPRPGSRWSGSGWDCDLRDEGRVQRLSLCSGYPVLWVPCAGGLTVRPLWVS